MKNRQKNQNEKRSLNRGPGTRFGSEREGRSWFQQGRGDNRSSFSPPTMEDRNEYESGFSADEGRYFDRYGNNQPYGRNSQNLGFLDSDTDVWRPRDLESNGQSNLSGRSDNWDYSNDGSDNRLSGEFSGRGPKGYRRSDERIREEVCDYLTAHGAIDASEIEVEVEDGEVTLTGTVQDRQTKRLAEDLCDEVRGVKEVYNQLRLEARASTSLKAQPGGGSQSARSTDQLKGKAA